MPDMFIFKNSEYCFDQVYEISKLNTYPLLSSFTKEMIVTIKYYNYQKNMILIQTLDFNEDIYTEFLKYFTNPKSISIMSRVCNMFYKIVKPHLIKLSEKHIYYKRKI
jgi:hypothetical protein